MPKLTVMSWTVRVQEVRMQSDPNTLQTPGMTLIAPPPTIFAPPPFTCCYSWCPWAGAPVGQVSACRSEDGERRANSVVSENNDLLRWHTVEVCDEKKKVRQQNAVFLQNYTLTGSGLHPFILFLKTTCQKVFTTRDRKEEVNHTIYIKRKHSPDLYSPSKSSVELTLNTSYILTGPLDISGGCR